MKSMTTNAVHAKPTFVLPQRDRVGVALLPVVNRLDGTRMSSVSPFAGTDIAYVTKTAGVAGPPGYPSWSDPV